MGRLGPLVATSIIVRLDRSDRTAIAFGVNVVDANRIARADTDARVPILTAQ